MLMTHIGWPGSIHDSRMLRKSSLWRKANEGSLMPAGYFVIVDSGYGLSDWMMVPYPASARTQPKETSFNFAISSTRIAIETSGG
ncbi:hypothetical protein PsorP6_004279 [Peronosclerospora sorghi]|uniref:Uncharacterized protein n=1 Tax=Peronosclerospora sorghi TaxID=230839 RepID=A0ACC0VJA9_9STRA|nr:hypothetical protein PsorP6_004279 [Peronosclerospora sorghi]